MKCTPSVIRVINKSIKIQEFFLPTEMSEGLRSNIQSNTHDLYQNGVAFAASQFWSFSCFLSLSNFRIGHTH